MDQLPVFLDLHGRQVLLVGGGEVAARKARLLIAAGARLRVVAPELCVTLQDLCERNGAQILAVPFAAGHLEGAMLAVAATDDPAVNRAVSAAGLAANVWVNAVDDAAASSCFMPAIIDRSPVIIAVGTGGASPTLARRLRAQLEAWLPQRLGSLAQLARRMRSPVRAVLADDNQRRQFWERFFDSALAARVLGGAVAAADLDAAFATELASAQVTATGPVPVPQGAVWLIGAGPGDPDLLTLRAQQLLQQCDVVLYDRLVPEAVLERVRRDALRVFVGKRPGEHRTTQARINELLLHYAARGLRVARLKGGDPLVFGRGGEEIAVLAKAGVPLLVVPGVTAAFGAAAAHAIPLTHRGLAQSVCFVTAMGEAAAALDWRALAAPLQTVVFYMGVAQLPRIVARLLQHGAPAERPAAVIERATQPEQRLVAGELGNIAARVAAAGIAAPALLMVGDVAQFARAAPPIAASPEP